MFILYTFKQESNFIQENQYFILSVVKYRKSKIKKIHYIK